jgi:hypothetical protein
MVLEHGYAMVRTRHTLGKEELPVPLGLLQIMAKTAYAPKTCSSTRRMISLSGSTPVQKWKLVAA